MNKPPVLWIAAIALIFVPVANTPAAPDEHGHEAAAGEHAEGEHADEVKLSAEAIARYRIRVEPVRRIALAGFIAAPARVAFNAEAMAHVGTPVAGRIAELRFRLGDEVKKGDVLLTIDSPVLGEAQSEYLQKRASVETARTTVEVAQTSYERSKALLEGKGLSLGEFQRREGEFKIAKGGLLAAQSAATAAENRLHLYGMTQAQVQALAKTGEVEARFQVRSPIAGRVIEREATLGEVVGPDREALLVLADMSKLWALADVPEARIAQVAVGAPARATFGASGNEAFSGTVAYISPQLNASTRSGSVRIELPNADSKLKPGMFGQVEIAAARNDGDTTATMIAVPEQAVQSVEGGPAVFVPVPNEENTFAKRAISIGPRIGSLVPVISGLKEGEPIVVGGAFVLKAELGKSGAAHEH